MARRVVTLGGGGFLMEPENPALDEWILTLAGIDRPRVCFVPTASGDADRNVQRFHVAYEALGARCDHLALFRRTERDLGAFLARFHVIYVGGGNTPNLLAVWRVHGVDRLLAELGERGTLLAGVSAGALCWFHGGVTDGFGGYAPLRDGLGLLPGTFCPHWDGESARQQVYRDAVRDGILAPGIAADDGAGALWVDGVRVATRTSRPGARVHVVG